MLAWLASFLDGGRFAFSLLIALGFARLARVSGDRLYGGFAVAFLLIGASDVMVGLHIAVGELSATAFVPRLLAFLLIVASIVDKNHRARRDR